VAHGGEKDDNAGFVSPNVFCFTRYFRHPHQILRIVKTIERSRVDVELITENNYKMANVWRAICHRYTRSAE